MPPITTQNDFLCSISLLTLHFFQLIGWWISIGLFSWLFLSPYFVLILPYLYWLYAIDYETPDKEGRPLKCLRNSRIVNYIRDYYPVKVSKTVDYQLDADKNYLAVVAPHGVLGIQAYIAFGTLFETSRNAFPYHRSQCANISAFYRIPFYRDILLAIGAGSSSPEALTYALGRPDGGRVVALVAGGAEESMLASPNAYKTILRRRKGFVRIAMRTGAPLVPVVAFNIVDDFDYQLDHPLLRRVQAVVKWITYAVPIVAKGRCGTYTLFPKRVPCTFVAGRPITMPKIEEPTQQQVDEVHERFLKEFEAVFEKHKHRYVDNPEKTFIEYV